MNQRFVVAVFLALFGCVPAAAPGGPTAAVPARYQEFFELPLAEQHVRLTALPIEEQVEIYLYAVTARHPPDLGFAVDVAKSGAVAVPVLLRRLENTHEEGAQQKLLYVFEWMAKLRSYDVRADATALEILRRTVTNMRNPLYRERSEASIAAVLHAPR